MLICSAAYAQENSSPYSSYGLGEKGGIENAAISGVGNNKVNFISPSILNISNPASYSYIKQQYPIFSVGLSSRFSTFQSNGATQKNATTGLSELAMGFSFAKRFIKTSQVEIMTAGFFMTKAIVKAFLA